MLFSLQKQSVCKTIKFVKTSNCCTPITMTVLLPAKFLKKENVSF